MLIISALSLILHVWWAQSSPLIPHEKRDLDQDIEDVVDRRRVRAETIIPMRIALKENTNALLDAESWLTKISHPDSAHYGRHWRQDEVISAFQPADDTVQIVGQWLKDHDIFDFVQTDNKMWFAFDVSAAKAEVLLQTEMYERDVRDSHGDLSRIEAFCAQYHLPPRISQHVDFVLPGVQGSDITDRTDKGRLLLKRGVQESEKRKYRLAQPESLSVAAQSSSSEKDGLDHCGELVTPACVRAMYGVPLPDPAQSVSSNNTMGFAEFLNDLYYQPDLDHYWHRYTNILNGTSPIFNDIDGARRPPTSVGESPKIVEYSGETDADLETAQAMIYPQNVTVFQVNRGSSDGKKNNYYNRFVAALDGSYCTPGERQNSSSGDKPQCGVFKPTNVISMSWVSNELSFSKYWQQRQCREYLKLGLQGVSVFIASGDYGVGLRYHTRTTKAICPGSGRIGTAQFEPLFPASCPWVTTVGGTEIPRNGSVYQPETAVEWHYTSRSNSTKYGAGGGGGFSIRFDRPSYQQAAVSHFFETADPRWTYFTDGNYKNSTGRYNRNGRGYPDVAANAKHMPLCYGNGTDCIRDSGTSFAAPIVGAIFNRIIEERLRVGKGPLGFLNPTLYQNPEAFTDVVEGGNGFCSPEDGFLCAPGWDPVTGLGTPQYEKLLDLFMNLP